MHAYAADTDRSKVLLLIGAGSVGLAFLVYLAVRAGGFSFPWWADIPGPLAIGTVVFRLYDRVLWRWHLGLLHLSKIPNFSGLWEGTVTSSFDGAQQTGLLEIDQRWSTMRIRYEPATRSSASDSTMASILSASRPEPLLIYEYENEPSPLSAPSMARHRGVARLRLTRDEKLAGTYYTGDRRNTAGEMMMVRRSAQKHAVSPCES